MFVGMACFYCFSRRPSKVSASGANDTSGIPASKLNEVGFDNRNAVRNPLYRAEDTDSQAGDFENGVQRTDSVASRGSSSAKSDSLKPDSPGFTAAAAPTTPPPSAREGDPLSPMSPREGDPLSPLSPREARLQEMKRIRTSKKTTDETLVMDTLQSLDAFLGLD